MKITKEYLRDLIRESLEEVKKQDGKAKTKKIDEILGGYNPASGLGRTRGYAGAATGGATVSPQRQQQLGAQTAAAEEGALQKLFDKLRADPALAFKVMKMAGLA